MDLTLFLFFALLFLFLFSSHLEHRQKSVIAIFVVATTRHSRTNDLTMSKALSRAIK